MVLQAESPTASRDDEHSKEFPQLIEHFNEDDSKQNLEDFYPKVKPRGPAAKRRKILEHRIERGPNEISTKHKIRKRRTLTALAPASPTSDSKTGEDIVSAAMSAAAVTDNAIAPTDDVPTNNSQANENQNEPSNSKSSVSHANVNTTETGSLPLSDLSLQIQELQRSVVSLQTSLQQLQHHVTQELPNQIIQQLSYRMSQQMPSQVASSFHLQPSPQLNHQPSSQLNHQPSPQLPHQQEVDHQESFPVQHQPQQQQHQNSCSSIQLTANEHQSEIMHRASPPSDQLPQQSPMSHSVSSDSQQRFASQPIWDSVEPARPFSTLLHDSTDLSDIFTEYLPELEENENELQKTNFGTELQLFLAKLQKE